MLQESGAAYMCGAGYARQWRLTCFVVCVWLNCGRPNPCCRNLVLCLALDMLSNGVNVMVTPVGQCLPPTPCGVWRG